MSKDKQYTIYPICCPCVHILNYFSLRRIYFNIIQNSSKTGEKFNAWTIPCLMQLCILSISIFVFISLRICQKANSKILMILRQPTAIDSKRCMDTNKHIKKSFLLMAVYTLFDMRCYTVRKNYNCHHRFYNILSILLINCSMIFQMKFYDPISNGISLLCLLATDYWPLHSTLNLY